MFRVVQPVPMMLSLLREYRNKGVTLKQVKRTFQSMENFHVQFTGVTSQRTGGGTAFMYALSARQLLDVDRKDQKGSVLGEFLNKLRERVPSYEEFDAAFGEVWFTEEDTRQRPLVRYLLRRIDQYRRKGTPVDYDLLTVEHLAPQSDGAAQTLKDAIGIMGNLLFVPEAVNKKLKNKSFKDKMEILRDSDTAGVCRRCLRCVPRPRIYPLDGLNAPIDRVELGVSGIGLRRGVEGGWVVDPAIDPFGER